MSPPLATDLSPGAQSAASAAFEELPAVLGAHPLPHHLRYPLIADERLDSSLSEKAFGVIDPLSLTLQVENEKRPQTVLYLAYGSNLADSTFLDVRHIRPLSAVNVVVPSLYLIFNLPGIPYKEPCFANTCYRHDEKSSAINVPLIDSHLEHPPYTNPSWAKGLVGTVYEVTLSDYAHIIATEGGGAGYQDVLVTCFLLAPGLATVPSDPEQDGLRTFKTHTLFAPQENRDGRNLTRPDPNWAQPSARYMGLLRTGAQERGIPEEYQRYLWRIQSYEATSQGQKMGAIVFVGLWAPLLLGVRQLSKRLADKNGKSPRWVQKLMAVLWTSMWASYDGFFRRIFGEGERTVEGSAAYENV